LPAACWIIEQPTLDSSGSQGFAAPPSGNARVARATYNRFGQLLTHEQYDGVTPAAAAAPAALPGMMAPSVRRSYAYDKGDLLTLTLEWPNHSPAPAPQTTTFRKYNERGQVLEFVSADGSVTALTYHARGWLTKHSHLPAGGNLQETTYSYDRAGQLRRATLPDGSFVTFSYDDARRLTRIADSAGNLERYTNWSANQLNSFGKKLRMASARRAATARAAASAGAERAAVASTDRGASWKSPSPS
jgi:YD repeat-containing protein